MAVTQEILELMKNTAKLRIDMLNKGITLYDMGKKDLYLQEYKKKLRSIENLIRRLNLKLVQGKK